MDTEKHTASSWLERIEEIINVLEGSTIGEFELTEGGTEIIIRRKPGMVMTEATGGPAIVYTGQPAGHASKVDTSIPIVSPLTGVYYSATSPTTPAFVNPGEVIHVGQVIALIEAMKVFNEINAEITGRVISIVATNGSVVQKGDVLLRIEAI